MIDKKTDNKNIYSLHCIKHCYGSHPTLDIDVLDIPEGCVMGLIGPNGSGKSTLLKILAFLEPYTAGSLLFDGDDISAGEKGALFHVTLLLQEPYLLRRSVYENVAYGLKQRGITTENIDPIVRDSLACVGLDWNEFAERPWYRLSGGEAQRVALAARLALRPKVLLLDEPTANVDESSAIQIREAVAHAWRDLGTTIIVATHDLVWLYEVADRIVSLYNGRIIGDGAENLIRGSWRVSGSDFIISFRGQRIVGSGVVGTPIPECASISPSDIMISVVCPSKVKSDNVLCGSVVQMSIERATGNILVTADCGGLFLRSRITLETARGLNLYPGINVYLVFPKTSLSFI